MKVFVALILFVCLFQAIYADRECRINTGDVYSARYPVSRSTYSGFKVFFVFGGDGKSGTENTQSETVFIEWEIDDDEELAVRDFRSNPSDVGCPSDIIGSYRVDWNINCFDAKLSLIQDACNERSLHYHGLTITKVRKLNTLDCGFYPEQVWKGKYPNRNNRYGGYDMSIVFGTDGESAVEHSDFATFYVEWENLLDRDVTTLAVRDFAANPYVETCSTRIEGLYDLSWDVNCKSVTIRANQDQCTPRREQYDGLTLTRFVDFEPFHNADDDDDDGAASSLHISFAVFALSCLLAIFFF
eukprot:TRINITY_DN712_c0_g2_i1.p1 TRINITY_DN712_c0_g2~~TRINITY_DN712_c0_g2_i1.p1  ORF type:complete len:300 (-),score=109.94 TRINITY_DN712_c0_g2_i1:141-1040(-)